MPAHVLLIQADAHGTEIVRDALAQDKRYEIEWVQTFALGLLRLHAEERPCNPRLECIAAILIDLAMPDVAGMEVIDRLQASSPTIPIVILSHARDEAVAQAALLRGASVELRSKDFAAGVAEILGQTGFDPQHLELELTETFLLQESKTTDMVLRDLKRLGVKLWRKASKPRNRWCSCAIATARKHRASTSAVR